jgi:hypothetical protein
MTPVTIDMNHGTGRILDGYVRVLQSSVKHVKGRQQSGHLIVIAKSDFADTKVLWHTHMSQEQHFRYARGENQQRTCSTIHVFCFPARLKGTSYIFVLLPSNRATDWPESAISHSHQKRITEVCWILLPRYYSLLIIGLLDTDMRPDLFEWQLANPSSAVAKGGFRSGKSAYI